nr:DUF5679 domain-containing protein [Petropleomorpha daqingensis]
MSALVGGAFVDRQLRSRRVVVPRFHTGTRRPVPTRSTGLSTDRGQPWTAGHGRALPPPRRAAPCARVACPQWRPGAPVSRCRDRGETVAESYNGYCVKCKEKRDFDGEVKVSESGRRMAQGTCPVCGTKMNRILGKA